MVGQEARVNARRCWRFHVRIRFCFFWVFFKHPVSLLLFFFFSHPFLLYYLFCETRSLPWVSLCMHLNPQQRLVRGNNCFLPAS